MTTAAHATRRDSSRAASSKTCAPSSWKKTIKADGIAACQLHAFKQHYSGKLRLTDVKEMFRQNEGSGMTIWIRVGAGES